MDRHANIQPAAAHPDQTTCAPCAWTSSSSDIGGQSQNFQSTGVSPIEMIFCLFTAKPLGTPTFERPVTFILPCVSSAPRSSGVLASNMHATEPFRSLRLMSPCSRTRSPAAMPQSKLRCEAIEPFHEFERCEFVDMSCSIAFSKRRGTPEELRRRRLKRTCEGCENCQSNSLENLNNCERSLMTTLEDRGRERI